jgi:hypothetical protein
MADKKLTPKQKKRLEDLFKKQRKDKGKRFDPKQYGKPPKELLDKLRKKKKDGVINFKELEKKLKNKPKVMEAKDGGKVSKFGMLSVKAGVDNNPNPTQADRIVGAKKKMNKGGAAGGTKKKRSIGDIAKKVVENFKKKRNLGDIFKTGPKRVPRPKLPKPKKPGEITRVPRPKLPKPSDFNKPRTVTPAKRKKPRKMATGGVAGRLAQRGYGKARS